MPYFWIGKTCSTSASILLLYWLHLSPPTKNLPVWWRCPRKRHPNRLSGHIVAVKKTTPRPTFGSTKNHPWPRLIQVDDTSGSKKDKHVIESTVFFDSSVWTFQCFGYINSVLKQQCTEINKWRILDQFPIPYIASEACLVVLSTFLILLIPHLVIPKTHLVARFLGNPLQSFLEVALSHKRPICFPYMA